MLKIRHRRLQNDGKKKRLGKELKKDYLHQTRGLGVRFLISECSIGGKKGWRGPMGELFGWGKIWGHRENFRKIDKKTKRNTKNKATQNRVVALKASHGYKSAMATEGRNLFLSRVCKGESRWS